MNVLKEHILPDNRLGINQIESIISESSNQSIDLSDIYFQYTTVKIQLNDIIEINAPSNEKLDKKQFLVIKNTKNRYLGSYKIKY